MQTVYRFETDDRRGCFAAGAARVRRTPSGFNVHNPGAYGDPLHGDPRQTLHVYASEPDAHAFHFGFFDLRQMRHWFGDPELIKAMYEKDGYWHKSTPLRRYEVPADAVRRGSHQVTFDSRKATRQPARADHQPFLAPALGARRSPAHRNRRTAHQVNETEFETADVLPTGFFEGRLSAKDKYALALSGAIPQSYVREDAAHRLGVAAFAGAVGSAVGVFLWRSQVFGVLALHLPNWALTLAG